MSKPVSVIVAKPGDTSFHFFGDAANINLQYLIQGVIAMRDGEPVGRLCIYDNPYIAHIGKPVLLFGNFECRDDTEVCSALMAFVEKEASRLNKSFIVGPMNGSTWDEYRLPLTEQVSPFLSDLQQPVYYSKLLQSTGFEAGYSYYSNCSDITADIVTDKQLGTALAKKGVIIRQIDMNRFKDELKSIHALSVAVFVNNLFYSPIDESGFIKKYLSLQSFLDSRFILLAEMQGNLLGFIFAFPDIYARDKKRLVLKTIAKLPSCDIKGLIDHMIKLLHELAFSAGYSEFVHAFMQEQNKSMKISGRYDGTHLREYALFIKTVDINA